MPFFISHFISVVSCSFPSHFLHHLDFLYLFSSRQFYIFFFYFLFQFQVDITTRCFTTIWQANTIVIVVPLNTTFHCTLYIVHCTLYIVHCSWNHKSFWHELIYLPMQFTSSAWSIITTLPSSTSSSSSSSSSCIVFIVFPFYTFSITSIFNASSSTSSQNITFLSS